METGARFSFLEEFVSRPPRFLFFGGKGGAGKTTLAAATGLFLAREGSGRSPHRPHNLDGRSRWAGAETGPSGASTEGNGPRILLVSVDPAHSLSDVLGQTVGNKIVSVPGAPGLDALEIAAEETFEAFVNKHRDEIQAIFESGTYLDGEDIGEILKLTIPGLDELIALKRILDFVKTATYSTHILDTAPTGHTLRMLTLSDTLDQWVQLLARLRWKYQTVLTGLTRRLPSPDRTDDFLVDLKKAATGLRQLLRDPDQTEFVPVTLPERLSVQETLRMLRSLETLEVPVRRVVVNRVLPEGSDCTLCSRWRKEQERWIAELRRAVPGRSVHCVPAREEEVVGGAALLALATSM